MSRYSASLADDIAARSPDPQAEERALLRQAMLDRLIDALTALPPRERAVATLRLMRGCSTVEVATELAMAPGTVKATLHHARAKLQRTCDWTAPAQRL